MPDLKALNEQKCRNKAKGTANNGIITKGNKDNNSVDGSNGTSWTGLGNPIIPTLIAITKSAIPIIFHIIASFLAYGFLK
mgnify:CR=1 FL=1